MSNEGIKRMIQLWLREDTRKMLARVRDFEDKEDVNLIEIRSMIEDLQEEMYGVLYEN